MVKSISFQQDVASAIAAEAEREERPFSQVVNRKLREAFRLDQKPTRRVSAATDSAGRRATPRRSGSRRKEAV